MRRYIFASHHKFAFGLKETVKYITNDSEKAIDIYDISAYVESDFNLSEIVQDIFHKFSKDDEIVILTDILFGSVNQAFMPYLNNNCHLITGVNVPLALELLLYPEDENLTKDTIKNIVKEGQKQIIYMNTYEIQSSDDDE